MKFKKTKLTALAMSVLMAASTITSVTWAADLFTDGAPAEVAVEESIDAVVSDGETVAADGEEESLMTAAQEAEVDFDPYGVYEGVDGTYKLDLKITQKADGKDISTTETITVDLGEKQEADCLHCEQYVCKFNYNGKSYVAIYKHEDGWKPDENHKFATVTIEDPALKHATCEEAGQCIEYQICQVCKEAFLDKYGKQIKNVLPSNDLSLVDADGNYDLTKVEEYLERQYFTLPGGSPEKRVENGSIYYIKEENKLGHIPKGDPVKTVIPPTTHEDYVGDKEVAFYESKANCRNASAGLLDGLMNPDMDAYYYNVWTCKNCGKTFGVKEYFYHANMVEGKKYYMKGEGVYGFVKKDDSMTTDDIIAAEDFKEVILENCENGGTYYLCTMNQDHSFATKEPIYEEAHHSWKPIEIKKTGDVWTANKDKYAYVTVNGNRVPKTGFVDGKFVVYSKDCITDAYFEADQVCRKCKEHNLAVAGKKECAKGPHDWDENSRVRDNKITYVQVDEKHHLEKYKDHITCKLCKEKDLVASKEPDALVDHKFEAKELKDTRVEPTCGATGSYQRADTCPCGYIDETTTTTVTIPATDAHTFNEPAFLEWSGEVYIKDQFLEGRSFHVDVVRKCSECGLTDSNGINTMKQGGKDGNDVKITEPSGYVHDHWTEELKGGKWCAKINVDPDSIVDAKKDPSTGVTYSCSTAHATIYVDWVGTVDGKVVTLKDTKVGVPYYETLDEYRGRTAHHKAPAVRENVVAPTDTTEGSYDEVIYCDVCGDEISRKTVKVSKLDPAIVLDTPAVLSAESVGYNSIKVTWSAVEGAVSYRLYYRGGEATNWTRVKDGIKGTTYTYTSNNLVSGVPYRFTVRAVSGDVLSGYSAKGKVATPKPVAPTVKSVAFSGSKATVTWSKVAGASGYIIQRKTTGGWTRVGTVKSGSKVTWTDKKAVSGATYRVRAYRTVENVNVYGPFSAAK